MSNMFYILSNKPSISPLGKHLVKLEKQLSFDNFGHNTYICEDFTNIEI